MMFLLSSSPNPAAIRFGADTSRTFKFRVAANDDTTATVTYSIESPGAAFSSGKTVLASIAIPALGREVANSLGFKKVGDGPVLQILVKAHVEEDKGGSDFDVFWVVQVLQAPPASSAGAKSFALAASLMADEGDLGTAERTDERDPMDPAELRRASAILQTLQAAVDSALAAGATDPEPTAVASDEDRD